jgi:hypothetical protein
VAERQPEARAFVQRLGGEEGSKMRGRWFGLDPGARVADLDDRAPLGVGVPGDADLVVRGGARRDRLGGVDEQVQKHLSEARLVGPDRRQRVVVLHEPRPVADLVRDQRDRRVQRSPRIDDAHGLVVGPGERLETAHDEAHPLRALVRAVQLAAKPLGRLAAQCRDGRRAPAAACSSARGS